MIEDIERRYDKGNKHGIMDKAFRDHVASEKAERATKKANLFNWITLIATLIGLIIAIIALFQ